MSTKREVVKPRNIQSEAQATTDERVALVQNKKKRWRRKTKKKKHLYHYNSEIVGTAYLLLQHDLASTA